MGHDEDVARQAAWQRIGLILPGAVLYTIALLIAGFFIPGSGDDSHGHYVPLLIIAAASAPQVLEFFAFVFTSYRRALPYNAGYVLHRSTEIFMVNPNPNPDSTPNPDPNPDPNPHPHPNPQP